VSFQGQFPFSSVLAIEQLHFSFLEKMEANSAKKIH